MKGKSKKYYGATQRYHLNGALARPDVLDKLILWRMDDVRYRKRSRREQDEFIRSGAMQRQFTIELRVDYADAEKNDAMRTALQAAARHVYATATLLADAVKPQIAIFSDDFFAGHEQITLLEDTIKAGKEQIGGEAETPVSDELMGAMRDSLIK